MKFLSNIKVNWIAYTQFAVWLLSIVATFLVDPPKISYLDSSKINAVLTFFIASLTALLVIPIRLWSHRQHYKRWLLVASICFVFSTVLVAMYYQYVERWGASYFGVILIKGEHMLESAKQDKTTLSKEKNYIISDEEFIKYRAGMTETIWPIQEIKTRFYVLAGIYIMNVVSIALFVMAISQSIYCFDSNTK